MYKRINIENFQTKITGRKKLINSCTVGQCKKKRSRLTAKEKKANESDDEELMDELALRLADFIARQSLKFSKLTNSSDRLNKYC